MTAVESCKQLFRTLLLLGGCVLVAGSFADTARKFAMSPGQTGCNVTPRERSLGTRQKHQLCKDPRVDLSQQAHVVARINSNSSCDFRAKTLGWSDCTGLVTHRQVTYCQQRQLEEAPSGHLDRLGKPPLQTAGTRDIRNIGGSKTLK